MLFGKGNHWDGHWTNAVFIACKPGAAVLSEPEFAGPDCTAQRSALRYARTLLGIRPTRGPIVP